MRTVAGALREALEQVLAPPGRAHRGRAHRRRRARLGPGRVVRRAGRRARPRPPQPQRQRAVRPGDRRPRGRGRPARTSTPASRPGGAATATRCSTARCPTRSWRRRPGTWPRPSTCRGCGWPATRSSASTTSRRSAAARGPGRASLSRRCVRRVLDATWDDDGDGRLRFEIRANAFCHQMVRSIVGRWSRSAREDATPATCRGSRGPGPRAAGQLAPPHGLCLWEVGY